LIVLVGAATFLKNCSEFVEQTSDALTSRLRLIHLQALIYALAGTIVFYTAAVSCLIEVGNPRYRVPTDSLIIFMLFLGTHLWRHMADLPRIVQSYRQLTSSGILQKQSLI
jgi:hypothetical protein